VPRLSLPSELVNQSIFTAALFLTFISVPKLVILTIWYTYRIVVYKVSERIFKSKYLRALIKQKNILQVLTKLSENPAERVGQMLKEYEHFTKDIRDSIIEASVALGIMYFVFPIFPQVQTWSIVSFIVIIGVILWALILFVSFFKEINRIPTQKEVANYEP